MGSRGDSADSFPNHTKTTPVSVRFRNRGCEAVDARTNRRTDTCSCRIERRFRRSGPKVGSRGSRRLRLQPTDVCMGNTRGIHSHIGWRGCQDHPPGDEPGPSWHGPDGYPLCRHIGRKGLAWNFRNRCRQASSNSPKKAS